MNFNEDKAIFVQIAESIENDILRDVLLADERAPSTNELAASLGINPNTAAKSLALLMSDGILYKKRGVGMFVDTGAKEIILKKRRQSFTDCYVAPMLREMKLLGITDEQLTEIIHSERNNHEQA